MRVRIGAAALAVTFASFLTPPAALFACQKCQFVEQGFQCAFASVSCCAVINGSSCEAGPCAGGCGSLRLTPAEAASGLASVQATCAEPASATETAIAPSALAPPGAEAKRAHSVVLTARR